MARKGQAKNFFNLIEEKYPDYIREINEETSHENIKAIPTGSLSLDVATRVGGFPMRRFSEVYGAEGTGKSTLAQHACKNAIEMGYSALYVDYEQALDLERARMIIGPAIDDRSKFLLMQPRNMEDALYLCESAIKERAYNLIILDSIGAMAPKKILEGTMDDNAPFVLASRLQRFLTRNAYDVRYSDVAFVGLNQVRDDTSGSFIKQLSSPGGHAWRHILSLRIHLTHSSLIKEKDGDTETAIGQQIRFVIRKSKVGPSHRGGIFPLIFDRGIDFYRDAVDFAVMLGVIKQSGAWYSFEEENLGKGVNAVIARLRDDTQTLDKIKNLCYTIVNTNSYTVTSDEESEEPD